MLEAGFSGPSARPRADLQVDRTTAKYRRHIEQAAAVFLRWARGAGVADFESLVSRVGDLNRVSVAFAHWFYGAGRAE